jgi:hypothetical protein
VMERLGAGHTLQQQQQQEPWKEVLLRRTVAVQSRGSDVDVAGLAEGLKEPLLARGALHSSSATTAERSPTSLQRAPLHAARTASALVTH